MNSNGIHSCYLNKCFSPQEVREMVRTLCNRLKPHRKHFDAIACQGWSGALVAPVIALRLNKPLVIVRKQGDNGHSCYAIEGYLRTRSYIIVDDFCASGQTVRRIIDNLRTEQTRLYHQMSISHKPATCYGVALYDQIGSPWRDAFDDVRLMWTCRDEWVRGGH